MSMPFALPPWLPWWVPILVLVPAILYALLFLLMPFSVIGVKGRLDVIEARLDELQGEIRTLSLRLGEPGRPAYRPDEDAYDTNPLPPPRMAAASPITRPPVPPAPDPYSYDDRSHDSRGYDARGYNERGGYDDRSAPRQARVVRPGRADREDPRTSRAEPRFD